VREPLAPGARIELPEPVVRHAVRVLRLPTGTPIALFDGRGGEYPAVLEYVDRDYAYAVVGAWAERECESPLRVTLVQAVQAGDKMDYTIQKAVELGVDNIIPVESRRSVIRLSGERLLVGAEGGLDEREVEAARLAGFTAIRLGPRILRTETAGLAALAALQTLWGDFNHV